MSRHCTLMNRGESLLLRAHPPRRRPQAGKSKNLNMGMSFPQRRSVEAHLQSLLLTSIGKKHTPMLKVFSNFLTFNQTSNQSVHTYL